MAQLYGPHLERIWEQALLLPGHTSLLASLAAEVAAFYRLMDEEAQRRMQEAWDSRAERLAAFPAGASASELASYYSGDDGVYRSMYWHSLASDRYPLHAVAGLHAVQQFAEGSRVFEFGHGVGSAGILFERHGFEVTLGDISTEYREFAATRLETRGLPRRFVDLTSVEPDTGAFDAVVSFDVLEHVPRPIESLALMRRALRPGGVLALNVAFGFDQENPEHLIRRRRGVLDRVRGLGFERIPHPTLLVFYRRELRRTRALYRVQDTLSAATDDVAGRWPRVGRVIRTTRTPPVG